MPISLKRVYEKPQESDGIRILVERLWPRGLSKEKAKVDIWLKDAAPSTELRKWFGHEPEKWDEFKKRYFSELDQNPESLKPILDLGKEVDIAFVFASKEKEFNNSVALKEYVEHFSS